MSGNLPPLANKALSIFQRDLLLFVTNLATSIIVARTLGPVALGVWTILTLVPSYAEAFARIKVDIASVYFIGNKCFRREDVLYNVNMIALLSVTVILAVILWQYEPIYGWLFKNETGDYRAELLVLMVQIPMQFLCLNYSYFHIAEENVTVYNRMVVLRAWSNSLTVIALLTLTTLGLWSVIIATLLSTATSLLYGWRCIDRSDWASGHVSKAVSFALIRYGFHFYVAGLLGQLQEYGTRLIAVSFLAPAQLAFLGQGQSVSQMLRKVSDAMNTILFPRISRSGNDAAVETTCTAFRISSILLLAGGVMMAVVAEPLIVLLYGEAFHPTASVVVYLLPGVLIAGTCSILGNYFNGTGRANLIPRIQLFPVIAQLFLAWLFLDKWGLSGAAVAISIGSALYGGLLLTVFIKASKLPVKQLVPGPGDMRYLVAFAKSRMRIRSKFKKNSL